MTLIAAYLTLLLAAVLEAAGDALVRIGLHTDSHFARIGLFVAGAAVLFSYFGRLLGVYVTLFFLVAQIINFYVFGVRPDLPIIVGGAFILTGGIIMTVWR
ncbi:MAG TPA: hypothetical protein PKE16_12230 [Hyphomicrobium sp.]|nr:hypothetical protein [Hyphomicrobium sp.]